MIYKSLFKSPMLAIGILTMAIFLLNLTRKGVFGRRDNLIPTSCRAALVKLERRIPTDWVAKCDHNNLLVDIDYKNESAEISKLNGRQLKALLYRELANSLMLIAQNSPSDNLERTDVIKLQLRYKGLLSINAVTFGDQLAKMVTLKDPKLIATHLQASVKIQETSNLPETEAKNQSEAGPSSGSNLKN